MTAFEQRWYDLYMKNMVTLDSLQKLVDANKLNQSIVCNWKLERLEKYNY